MNTKQWNEIVLEACRRSWNMPHLTLEELRAKQLGAAKPCAAKSDIQFDYDNEREEQRITPLQQKWENG